MWPMQPIVQPAATMAWVGQLDGHSAFIGFVLGMFLTAALAVLIK